MNAGDRFGFKEELSPMFCPCGGTVRVGFTTPRGDGMVMHGKPACKDFMDMEPSDFLRWLREHLEKREGAKN